MGTTAFAGAVLLAAVLLLGREEGDRARDPSRRGPERVLRVTHASVEEGGQAGGTGLSIRVAGTTNLPDGARLTAEILSGSESLWRQEAIVRAGAFALEEPAGGEVTGGRYELRALFRLEEQTEAVRADLAYQPASLEARAPLVLPPRVVAAGAVQEEVRTLHAAVCKLPSDPADLAALDVRASALAARLGIARERLAVERLRRALAEAARPEPRRADIERLLVEAHVLGGL